MLLRVLKIEFEFKFKNFEFKDNGISLSIFTAQYWIKSLDQILNLKMYNVGYCCVM